VLASTAPPTRRGARARAPVCALAAIFVPLARQIRMEMGRNAARACIAVPALISRFVLSALPVLLEVLRNLRVSRAHSVMQLACLRACRVSPDFTVRPASFQLHRVCVRLARTARRARPRRLAVDYAARAMRALRARRRPQPARALPRFTARRARLLRPARVPARPDITVRAAPIGSLARPRITAP
jgi:hypothetical protein